MKDLRHKKRFTARSSAATMDGRRNIKRWFLKSEIKIKKEHIKNE